MATSTTTILESSRLILRAAVTDDAVSLHEAFKDAEVMRYWSSLPHADLARTQSWIRSMVDSPQNGVTDFAVCMKTGSMPNVSPSITVRPIPIGKIGIYDSVPSNEIGFMLARMYWGKGLAREALEIILEHLFSMKREIPDICAHGARIDIDAKNETRNAAETYTTLTDSEQDSAWVYPSITADTDPRNGASIGLLKKVGFVESGYLERSMQVGEEWVDSLYLKLEREQWVLNKGV